MKLLLVLATTLVLSTNAAQAARVCVKYDVYGNCLQWQNNDEGEDEAEAAPGQCPRVCQIYDVYGECKKWVCAK